MIIIFEEKEKKRLTNFNAVVVIYDNIWL